MPARLEPTISLSKGYVTLAGENDSNDSCSPGSTTALQSTPNSHKCYPEVKKLRVLGGFECQLSAGPPVVDRTSTAQQRSTSPKSNTTNNNRDRCIYHRIGCSYRFEICEWEMVRTGEERAHQSPELRAAGLALESFVADRRNQHILLRMDNRVAIAYLNSKGGTISETQPQGSAHLGLVPSQEPHH